MTNVPGARMFDTPQAAREYATQAVKNAQSLAPGARMYDETVDDPTVIANPLITGEPAPKAGLGGGRRGDRPKPDHDLPEAPDLPGHALPEPPARPGHDLPEAPNRPGHELPEKPDAPARPGHALPEPPARPGHELPEAPSRPGHDLPEPPARPGHELPETPDAPARPGHDLPSKPAHPTHPIAPPEAAPKDSISLSEAKAMLDENPKLAKKLLKAELKRDGGPRRGMLQGLRRAALRLDPMDEGLLDDIDATLQSLDG